MRICHDREGIKVDICFGERTDGDASFLEPFEMVVLFLAGDDDVLEKWKEFSGDGEGFAVPEVVRWRAENGAEEVVFVKERYGFDVDLLTDKDEGVVSLLFVCLVFDNVPVVLEDDGQFEDERLGVNILSHFQGET